jgi:DNA-binding transcriptional ArsR family regulator
MKIILNALAEPNRLQIVELLRDGPLTVGEITNKLGMKQPQVSKHLRVLSETGLVEVQPIANRRYYRLRPQPFKELDSWVGSYSHLWNERLDRLDEYLQKIQRKGVDE